MQNENLQNFLLQKTCYKLVSQIMYLTHEMLQNCILKKNMWHIYFANAVNLQTNHWRCVVDC